MQPNLGQEKCDSQPVQLWVNLEHSSKVWRGMVWYGMVSMLYSGVSGYGITSSHRVLV